MDETITIDLFDTKSIDRAIKQLNEFKKTYETNVKEYKMKLAEECASYANANIDNSWYDDYVDVGEGTYAFSARTPNCYCYVDEKDDEIVVIGTGDFSLYDGSTVLVWVEFGAGMHYNLNIGGSPHEWGNTVPKGIGEYGYKQGKHHAWHAPYGLSRGTKAQMPLYNACIQTEQVAKDIAKEIFK